MPQNVAAQLFVEPFDIDGQELRPSIRSGVASIRMMRIRPMRWCKTPKRR